MHQVAVGVVGGLYRYPVKSMAGQELAEVQIGWHGIEGDRRYAFLREDQKGGFPWLSASRLPSLLLYRPVAPPAGGLDPTHVTTPSGATLELEGEALREELSTAFGSSLRLMRLNHGMFDDAPLSLISTTTIDTIARAAGRALDIRRFRPNILVETAAGEPFPEEAWMGGRLRFGDGDDAPVMGLTRRDVRCTMIGLDPDTADAAPEVLKATVRINDTCAGLYGSTLRTGPVAVGAPVYLLGDAAS